jgi:DNA-binding transcriptional MocR family regulator
VNILVHYLPDSPGAKEITRSVELAVRHGDLSPGDQLPAVRGLASALGVSPSTVAAAYQDLRRRGITTGSGRGGTRIRARPAVSTRPRLTVPPHARDLLSGAPDPRLLPALPCRRPAHRRYDEPPVAPRLARLATGQLAADGIDPANLAVTGGALDGVERVLNAWLAPGDRVIVEDPGHPVTLDLVAAMGFRPVPVRLDELGIRPDALAAALARDAEAIILTPRAQAATGAAWDTGRAADLRQVLARRPGLLTIEDDHAGPVAGAPVHSVCAGRERWAVLRSVSKSLGPDLRLAVLAGDEVTVGRVEGRQALGTGWVSYQLQETVADLWADQPTVELLRKASQTYAERRIAVQSALRRHGIAATGQSGLTSWIPVADEEGMVSGLLAAGWAVAPGQRFRIASPAGVRISFASLPPAEAAAFAGDLARCLRQRHARAD